jgi:hypothetical protein
MIPEDPGINLMNTHMGGREEHAQFYKRKTAMVHVASYLVVINALLQISYYC